MNAAPMTTVPVKQSYRPSAMPGMERVSTQSEKRQPPVRRTSPGKITDRIETFDTDADYMEPIDVIWKKKTVTLLNLVSGKSSSTTCQCSHASSGELPNAQDDAAGPLGIGFAPQHIAFVPERQQEEAGIQNQRHTNVAQRMLPPNLIAPATNEIQVGPMLSPVELARTFLLSGKISRLLKNHQYGSLTGTPRSSRSKTHSSPPKAPKRPRDRKRDAETKGKVTDASDKTPIKLVSPDDKEMQLTTAVELRYISTPSTNMCHTYSTSTFSTQLPPQLNSPSTRKCHVGHPAALQDLELQGQ
ncbi:hypothetical protein CAEBREN_29575 [Caenorhabditis brenneri]|uniref:Uncharacterized protein n=1 Tax=Caenorhabditis brenneri TaxID=135651 RepID=G0NB83_CAEBE|nr:hypothetical protein CAEBREN_29575 [Caenorhabditis brenneri]